MKIYILFILSFIIFSCTKDEKGTSINEDIVLKLTSDESITLNENLEKIPLIIKYFDEQKNRYIDFDCKNRTVTFSKGWSFSNPKPNTIYSQSGNLVLYMSSSSTSFGYGNPTSSITVGSKTLNVQTLCVAVDASAYSQMFSSQTGSLPYDGISVVLGLDADFSLLANASSTNFANYFHGVAYYLVYDFNASGKYTVIDWLNGLSNLSNSKAFAYVFTFDQNNNGGFYFSQDGDITVSGGDMNFNGNYWGIETNFTSINPNLTYQSYPGSGKMGCN